MRSIIAGFNYHKCKLSLFFWKKIETMPRFVINYWQLAQLKRIVREAHDRVFFYRKLYDAHSIHPERLRKLNDIKHLPIISRQLLRRHPLSEITNDAFAPHQYRLSHTSGSTAEPFSFPVSWSFNYQRIFGDDSGEELSVSHYDRFLLWRGLSYKYIREKIRTAEIRSAIIRPRGKYFLPLRLFELRKNPQKFFFNIAEFKPHVLDGRPTALVELARLAEEFKEAQIPQARFVISTGEALTRAAREIIEDTFGAEVYNIYGLEETGVIGAECEEHNGMHLFEESCLVEILDEKNNPLPSGNFGHVIITYFNSDVMPFIRYDTGDCGRIITAACGCGLNTSRIEIGGRYGGFIEIGSEKYHSIELEMALRRFCSNMSRYRSFCANILRYQFVKKRDSTLNLRIIIKEKIAPEDMARLRMFFKKKLGLVINMQIVDDIPCQDGDKNKTFVDESNNNLFYK